VSIESRPADYSMRNLGPSAYSALSESFILNDTHAQRYHENLWKHGPQTKHYCDSECKKNLFCDSYYSDNVRKLQCNDKDFAYIKLVDYAANTVLNPWVERIS